MRLQDLTKFLPYGSSKLLIDSFLYIDKKISVSYYKVQEGDVEGHFGLFRGVDMIELSAQTMLGGALVKTIEKENLTLEDKGKIDILFAKVGETLFKKKVELGEYLVCVTKFRKIGPTCSGESKLFSLGRNTDNLNNFASVTDQFKNSKFDELVESKKIG